MLYPIKMNFHNAREFQNVSLYFNSIGADKLTDEDIVNNHKEHVLIGGLNGAGKSTIASAYMCVLNAHRKDVAPEDLVSSYKNYTREEPWIFKGYILFYNDGALEDCCQYVKIVAKFRGYSRTIGNKAQYHIEEKVFEIYEDDSLSQIDKGIPTKYSNMSKYNTLSSFDEQLERLGISPKKFLLYWKQGATNKFTAVNHNERFEKFASMLKLDEKINKLDRLEEQQLKRQDDLRELSFNLDNLKLKTREVKVEADKKERRDDVLKKQAEELFSTSKSLDNFAISQVDILSSSVEALDKEIFEITEQNIELSSRLEELIATISDMEKEILDTEINKNNADKEYENLKREKETISNWLNDNRQLYKDIQTLITDLERENLLESKELSIAKVANLVKEITKEVVALDSEIKVKKEFERDTKLTLSEKQTSLGNIETGIDELNTAIIKAENIIDGNHSEHELTDIIEKNETEISRIQELVKSLTEQKESILATASSYLYLLEKAKTDIKKNLEKVVNDLEKKSDTLEDCENERNAESNKLAVCKSKIEGMSLEEFDKQLSALDTSLTNQEDFLVASKKHFDKSQDKLQTVYKCLEHTLPALNKKKATLQNKIVSSNAKLESKDKDLIDKEKLKEETDTMIQSFSFSIEKYEEEIEILEKEEKTIEIELSATKKKKKLTENELKEFKGGLFRSVDEDEFLDEKSYYFHDVFQLVSQDLGESKILERRLTLIKNAVFIDARSNEIRPKSQKYHIPLKEFEFFEGKLPFGLILNSDIPKDIALRASEWLVRIAEYIDEDGIIRDPLGARGFKEEKSPSLVLNKILKEWTIENMDKEIRKYEELIDNLTDKQNSLKRVVKTLRNDCSKLSSHYADLERMSGEIVSIKREIAVLNEEIELNSQFKQEVDRYIEGLTPLHKNLEQLKDKFILVNVSGKELTKEEMLKEKDNILMDIPVLKKLIEEIDACEKSVNSIKKHIEKTQELRTFYIKTRDEATRIEAIIKDLEIRLNEFSIVITTLSNKRNELENWRERVKANIDDIEKYFGDVKSMETKQQYTMEELLAKTERIYNGLRLPLNGVELSIEEGKRDIDSLQERHSKNYQTLEKVIKAQEELKKKAELIELKKTRDDLNIKIARLQAEERIVAKEIESLEKEYESTKLSQERFQQYLDKWEGVEWSFYEEYNEKSDKINIINSQLAPLAEKSKQLTQLFHELRENKINYESSKSELSSKIASIESDIEVKSKDKKQLESKAQDYSNQLNHTFKDIEGYKEFITQGNLEKLTLKDYIPTFKSLYLTKFSMDIEEGYVMDFSSFEDSLNLATKDISSEEEFKLELKGLNKVFSDTLYVLRENIQEDSKKRYELITEQYLNTKKDKEATEIEVAKNASLVAQNMQELEQTISSSVNRAQAILTEKLDKLGYVVKLEYESKDTSNVSRQLKLYFSKTAYGTTLLREIRGDNDNGMSGGEHAAVSLMIMYAIMKVKETMDNASNKQGGYLLLDEWDANLDPVNSRIIFSFLEELGKKIISITPRSNYEEYIDKFGVLIRVVNAGTKPMVAIINRNNESQVREMIEEAKLAEIVS